MLVYFALGKAHFSRFTRRVLLDAFYPTHFTRRQSVEYRLRWVPGVGSLRWACTFHALGDANCTRRKPVFWWNMGLKYIDFGGFWEMAPLSLKEMYRLKKSRGKAVSLTMMKIINIFEPYLTFYSGVYSHHFAENCLKIGP